MKIEIDAENLFSGSGTNAKIMIDPFGIKTLMTGMENLVRQQYDANANAGCVGFNLSKGQETKPFLMEGISWSALYIFSRLIWICHSYLPFLFHPNSFTFLM